MISKKIGFLMHIRSLLAISERREVTIDEDFEPYNPEDIKVELIEEEIGHKLPHPKIQITIGRVIMEIRSDDADKIATMIHKIAGKSLM